MRIHGICVLKDEVDVISHSLEIAARWCDRIYVLDNGSTDGTWEAVQRLSRRHGNIVPFAQEKVPYRNTLRADVFNAVKDRASAGDWWCKLDADEFYIDNPYRFLVRVPDRYRLVFGSSFQFQFTERDLEEYAQDPEGYEDRPVTERLRHYINNWSEPRFVRHAQDGIWDTGHPSAEPVFPFRIWLKHYQYRSPGQIQRRLVSRRKAAREGAGFKHEISTTWGAGLGAGKAPDDRQLGISGEEWRERVVPAASLDVDTGDGKFIPREDLLNPLPPRGLKSEVHDVYSLLRTRAGKRLQRARARLGRS